LINYWIAGIYPRNETLIESTRLYDKTLRKQFNKEKTRLLKIQSKNRFNYITDPLIDWDDNIRPFTDNLKGIEKGPLTRYYENNTFYRQPIITNKITTSGKILKNNICFNLFSDKSKPKVDILDPFTFYDLSANEFYKSEEEAINAFADIIKKELNSIKKDIELIQFNAPSLARVKEKEQLDIIRKAMVKIVKGLDVTTCLNLWGSDVSDTLEAFQDFPVDIIGIDFTTSKIDKFDQIDINKGLACGLIDAKNTKMEKTSEIIRELKNIKELFKPTSLAVIPSWDFELIPETFACKKLDIMKQIKEKTRVMKL
jgi:5-methyltetrahydropteroyltriglutamate--homocysteine methyltransferase